MLSDLNKRLVPLYDRLFKALGLNVAWPLHHFDFFAHLRHVLKQTGREERDFMTRWFGHSLLVFFLVADIALLVDQVYQDFNQWQIAVTVLFLPTMFMFWYFRKPFSDVTKLLTSVNSDILFLASSVRASVRAGESLSEALREASFAGDGYLFQEIGHVVAEGDSTGDISSALVHLAERSPSRELTKLINVFLEAASGINIVSSLNSFIERNRALKRTKLLDYQKVSDTISVTTPMFTLILFIVEVMVMFASIYFIQSPQTIAAIIGVIEVILIPIIYIFSLITLQEGNPGL